MLQELATQTGAAPWAVASMLFFIGIYVVVAVRVVTARPEELDAQARMALDDDEERPARVTSGTGAQA